MVSTPACGGVKPSLQADLRGVYCDVRLIVTCRRALGCESGGGTADTLRRQKEKKKTSLLFRQTDRQSERGMGMIACRLRLR